VKFKRFFENSHWIVVEKPAGSLTTPARTKDDPRPVVGLILQQELGRQIYPVHRLDFEVGGLVLFALDADHHRKASAWFEHGFVVKTYSADTVPGRGEPPREWCEWRSKMLRGKRRSYVSPHGKDCFTEARVVEIADGRWRWELKPHTGRPHQLRVELANHGAPILGDVLYGGPIGETDKIALTAVSLNFENVPLPDRAGLPARIDLIE
jgi:tRNA pseudouridine32 synthase/23S rRNA pseudouridine746 synthase